MEKGHLKALDPQPLLDPLPARHNPTKYYAYHQHRGHGIDHCYRLRHNNQTIAPPQDPNVTTNPLPIQDRISPAHLNLFHTLLPTFNPSIYITPAHLPKPEPPNPLAKQKQVARTKRRQVLIPILQLRWAIKTSKIKGLNKQQVLEFVAKTVDITFVARDERILN
ncbi:hypothetical protein HYC85_029050 [Camellia sinensis]|uniref:Uncharacterized protein n=1 Tax=Camellia sinensis TaxID=4442 RepID=A0A7J7FX53_CAMSI|nr:hypothetical protein HYC85_029050 [Camellia sinensis]